LAYKAFAFFLSLLPETESPSPAEPLPLLRAAVFVGSSSMKKRSSFGRSATCSFGVLFFITRFTSSSSLCFLSLLLFLFSAAETIVPALLLEPKRSSREAQNLNQGGKKPA